MMSTKTFETFEDELDAIRLNLYEEVKGMTHEEEIAYLKARVAPIHEQFGIRMSDLEPITPIKRETRKAAIHD